MTDLTWRVVDLDTDPAAMEPLADSETSVRVTETLTERHYKAVAELLRQKPDAVLWLDHHGPDLQMLRFFPGLRRLTVTSLRLTSCDEVRQVADSLEELALGETLRPVSIAPIGDLGRLRSLGLTGPVRHVDALARLAGIEELSLRSVTLPDLSLLLHMQRLRSLYIGLGGTSEISLLPELTAVEDLELWRIRGMRDLTPLASCIALRVLNLQAMSAVTEIPSLADLRQLRHIGLETMRGITDLAPVAAAPALEELLLIEMCQLQPGSLRPLVGHPTLRRGIWGLCSDRKNAEAWELLPLGDPPFNYERWKARQARRRRPEA